MKKCVVIILIFICWIMAIYAQQNNCFLSPNQIDPLTYKLPADSVLSNQALQMQAYEYYNKQDYVNAARFYLAALQFNPQDSGALYNLACCYGLMNQADKAAEYVRRAYVAGFYDLGHIQNDTDFTSVKAAKPFTAVLDTLAVWDAKRQEMTGKLEYYPVQSLGEYTLYLPKGFDAKRTYHLVVGLHGYGDTGENYGHLWRALKDSNIIFVVPEAPYPWRGGEKAGFSWSPAIWPEDKTSQTAYGYLNDAIASLTRQMQKQYKIDQTWLMGFSQGAGMTMTIGMSHPELFNGLLVAGGWFIPEVTTAKVLKKAKGIKVIISHGDNDKVVDYQEGVKANEALTKAGIDVKFNTFQGGHQISKEGIQLMLDWMNQPVAKK